MSTRKVNRRTTKIEFRLSHELKAQAQQMAKESGLSTASWLKSFIKSEWAKREPIERRG